MVEMYSLRGRPRHAMSLADLADLPIPTQQRYRAEDQRHNTLGQTVRVLTMQLGRSVQDPIDRALLQARAVCLVRLLQADEVPALAAYRIVADHCGLSTRYVRSLATGETHV